MAIGDLPPEIILQVVQWLDYAYEINSLARPRRAFYTLLDPLIYAKYSHADGHFALRWAAAHGSEPAVYKVLATGVEPTPEVMLLAATFGHANVVTLLHEKGVDINAEGTSTYVPDNYRYKPCLKIERNMAPLVRAVVMGHERVVKLLLDIGANPNCAVPSNLRGTLLEVAACEGASSIIKLLIEAQKKLNCPDLDKQLHMSLYIAAKRNDCASVETLLEAGAKPSRFRANNHVHILQGPLNSDVQVLQPLLEYGYKPTLDQLHRLMIYHKLDKVRLLMQWVDFHNFAEDDYSRAVILGAFAMSGNLPLIKNLISRGWKVDGAPCTERGPWGFKPRLPLIWAALYGHLHVVQFLLAQGVYPFGSVVDDNDGAKGRLLAAAVFGGHIDIVTLLLDLGLDPNTIDNDRPVLTRAIKHDSVFKLLLDRGADLNFRTARDNNPFSSLVVRKGTEGVIRLMCERGVCFDHPTLIPVTVNHESSNYTTVGVLGLLAQRNLSVLHTLVEYGLDPHSDRADAGQALVEAVKHANIPYLRYLLDRGFNPLVQEVEFSLILQAANLEPRREPARILDMLLAEGLNIDALNESGQTPLLYFVKNEREYGHVAETVRLLLSRGANPIFQCPRGEFLLIIVNGMYDLEIVKAVSEAIDARCVPFEDVKMQLLRAMESEVRKRRDQILRILRKVYWRRRYPVED